MGGIDNKLLCHLLNAQNNNTVNTGDEPEIIKHSPCYNDSSLNNLFLKKGNMFNILSLNCQSINAKFDQINIKLQS